MLKMELSWVVASVVVAKLPPWEVALDWRGVSSPRIWKQRYS